MQRDSSKEILINKFDLFQEWIEQGEKADYWAKQASAAQRECDEADLAKKIKEAELGKKYRLELIDSGQKPTDKVVDELIKTDPEYKKFWEDYIAAKERATNAEDNKWNFISRKVTLEKIQEGILFGLYGDPRDNGGATSIRDEIRRRRNNRD